MNYLSREISDLTAFLTTREKERLYGEFCGGARYSTAGETTIVTIHEAVRKIKTIYYITRKLLPARNGKGQELFFYIGDTDVYLFHPDNLNIFKQTCVIHGMTPQDIKELNKKEQIGRLLKLKYQRQDVCLGEPFNIGVKPITMSELYGEPPLKKCIKQWKWWWKQFK